MSYILGSRGCTSSNDYEGEKKKKKENDDRLNEWYSRHYSHWWSILIDRFSVVFDVDDDGRKAVANVAYEPVVKFNFHHDGGVSYGDEVDADAEVAYEVNILERRGEM